MTLQTSWDNCLPYILHTRFIPTLGSVGSVCCGCCALSSGLVGGLYPCQLDGEPTQSVLSCLPQSVNWRVCELSGQRGVKRNPADSNKHHTFQSSWACEKKKSHASRKIVCQADFVKIKERWVLKVKITVRAVWEQAMRKRSEIWMLGEK